MKQNIFKLALLSALFAGPIISHGQNEKSWKISGILENAWPGDTIELDIWNRGFISERKRDAVPHLMQSSALAGGKFAFSVENLTQPCYFSLIIKNAARNTPKGVPVDIVNLFLAMPGDSLDLRVALRLARQVRDSSIAFDDWRLGSILFAGRGAAAYRCQHDLLTQNIRTPSMGPDSATVHIRTLLCRNFQQINFRESFQQSFIQSRKADIGDRWVLLLSKEVKGAALLKKFDVFYRNYAARMSVYYTDKKVTVDSASFLSFYRDSLAGSITGIREAGSQESKYLICCRLGKMRAEDLLSGRKKPVFVAINEGFTGQTRDRLMAAYFLEYYEQIAGADSLVENALATAKDVVSREILDDLMEHKQIGRPAYPFILPDIRGEMVGLDKYKGKVVLVDFWYTGCVGCRGLYENTLKPIEEAYRNNPDIVFISVSIDRDKKTWIHSANAELYTSRSAVNLYTSGAGEDHPVVRAYHITGYPYLMLLDKKGNILSNRTVIRSKPALREAIDQALR